MVLVVLVVAFFLVVSVVALPLLLLLPTKPPSGLPELPPGPAEPPPESTWGLPTRGLVPTKWPRGGFQPVESDFEVQNDVGQTPGMKMDEFMRFANVQKFRIY